MNKNFKTIHLQKFARSLAHLLIFSSIFMGIGAVSMTLLTFEIINDPIFSPNYIWFVFFASIFIYCLHRVIGIEKVKEFSNEGRFLIIKKYQKHIWFFGLVGAFGSAFCFYNLSFQIKLLLLVPALISMAYVLPIFPGAKRLRDLPFVKVFMIGMIWGWVTASVPLLIAGKSMNMLFFLATLERIFFFTAAALPFDIRDKKVDEISNVKTIPTVFGVRKSKLLSWIFLLLHFLLASYLSSIGYYKNNLLLPFIIYFLCCSMFIYHSDEDKEHLYFTVFLDGTLIILPLLVWVFA